MMIHIFSKNCGHTEQAKQKEVNVSRLEKLRGLYMKEMQE